MLKLQENEQLLISTILKSKEQRIRVLHIISNPEHYLTISECKDIFKVIKSLHHMGKEVNLETVNSFSSVEFKDIKEIHDKYGEIELENIDIHLELLRKNSLENDVNSKYLTEIYDLLSDNTKSYEYKIKAIQDLNEEIRIRRESSARDFQDMAKLVETQRELLDARRKSIEFCTTGDARVDNLMSYGYTPMTISIIAGRPSNGKSQYALNNARRLANLRIPAAIFNLEMRNVSAMDRLISMGTEIETTRMVKNFSSLNRYDINKLNGELDRISSDMTLFMDDDPVLDMDTFQSMVGRLQEKLGKEYIVVFSDLFTKFQEFHDAQSAWDIEKICNKMQKMTRKLGIHNIIILQIRRDSDKIQLRSVPDVVKMYPKFHMIKNSGAFEEVADNIFLICRPSNYLHQYAWGEYVPDFVRLELAKQRDGGQTSFSDVLLYKCNNNYMGLIEPEENWDPLEINVTDEDLDKYSS
jgi:replicative DNA helicase